MTATEQQHAAFDHQVLVDGICTRLRKHIDSQNISPSIEEELVVGIFGSWGSGKSHVLDTIGKNFADDSHITPNDTNKKTVITVRFNAWQYEKEPLLMVPLLKHIEAALQHANTQNNKKQNCLAKLLNVITHSNTQNKEKTSFWKKLLNFVSHSTAAFASSVQGKVSVTLDNTKSKKFGGIPLVGNLLDFGSCTLELAVNPKDFIDSINNNNTQSTEQPANTSPYYDFHQQLQLLMEETQTHLLFLIDDLDRCLPEKALQMLETIKLFFAISQCSFVLAVDDEVVERGVMHRYKEYLFHNQDNKNSSDKNTSTLALPITGAEYLEKIIHLPVRLHQTTGHEMHAFLMERYPDLFEYRQKKQDGTQQPPETNESHASPKEDNKAQQKVENQKWRKIQHAIGTLFSECVPPQPRKLIRAAELLDLRWNIAKQCGTTNEQALYLLARLVLIQLFAPEVYRFCMRKPLRFSRLADWHATKEVVEWLYDTKTAKNYFPKATEPELEEYRTLRRLIIESCQQRSEFSLQAVFRTNFFDL